MAAPTIVTTQVSTNNATTSHSFTVPTCSVGDLLILLQTNNNFSVARAVTGWTEDYISSQSSVGFASVKHKRANSTDAAGTTYSWTTGSSTSSVCTVLVVASGTFDTSVPVDRGSAVTVDQVNTTAQALPTITSPDDARLIGWWTAPGTHYGSAPTDVGTVLANTALSGATAVSSLVDTYAPGVAGLTYTRTTTQSSFTYSAVQFAINAPQARNDVSVRSVATTPQTVAANSVTAALPSSFLAGDLLVAFVDTKAAASITLTGWTFVGNIADTTGSTTVVSLLTKVATSTDVSAAGTNIVFASNASVTGTTIIYALAVDRSYVMASASGKSLANTTTYTPTALTPSDDNWTLFEHWASNGASGSVTPGTWTEILDTTSNSILIWAGYQKLSGQNGVSQAPTITTPSTTGAGYMIALVGPPQVTALVAGVASLTGTGTSSTTGSASTSKTATLSGVGSLSATAAAPYTDGSASLSGAGTLSGTAVGILNAAASLSGAGTLTATGTASSVGAASIAGVGSLTANPGGTVTGAAAITGVGSLSATPSASAAGIASLTGTGSLTASSSLFSDGVAALLGSGTLIVAGRASATGSGALTGTGVLSATAGATARLSGTGSLTAQGSASAFKAAHLTGTGLLRFTVVFPGAAHLTGLGSIRAKGRTRRTAPQAEALGTAHLTGVGSLTGHGDLVVGAVAHLTGVGTLIVTLVTGEALGQALLTGLGRLDAQGTASAQGAGSASGLGVLFAFGTAQADGSGSASGLGTLSGLAILVFPRTPEQQDGSRIREHPGYRSRDRLRRQGTMTGRLG